MFLHLKNYKFTKYVLLVSFFVLGSLKNSAAQEKTSFTTEEIQQLLRDLECFADTCKPFHFSKPDTVYHISYTKFIKDSVGNIIRTEYTGDSIVAIRTMVEYATMPLPPARLNDFLYYCAKNQHLEADVYVFMVLLKVVEAHAKEGHMESICSNWIPPNGFVELVRTRLKAPPCEANFFTTWDAYEWLFKHRQTYKDYPRLLKMLKYRLK